MTADRIDDDEFVVPRRLGDGEPPLEERRHWFPPIAWWLGLGAPERVLYRGLVLLAGGLWFVEPSLAAIVPGAVLAAIAIFTLALIAWRTPY